MKLTPKYEKSNKHDGISLEDLLKEEGLYKVCAVAAIKELIAEQIKREMKAKRLTKVMMARRMKTSRTAIDRLLDPDNVSVTLMTLMKAAAALGKDLRIELV